MTGIDQIVDQLSQVCETLATQLATRGIDLGNRRTVPHGYDAALTVDQAISAYDALNAAARVIISQHAHIQELVRDLNQARSSNGALMVDRDRAQREGQAKATAAFEVARKALDAAEIDTVADVAELRTVIDNELRHSDEQWARMSAAVDRADRADRARVALIGVPENIHQYAKGNDGLTMAEVTKVVRAINRAIKIMEGKA